MRGILILSIIFCVLTSCYSRKGSHFVQLHTKDSLNVALDKIYQQGLFNGFAVAIVDEKSTLYEKGFGFADAREKKPYTEKTIQNIASVSKTFVGITILKAQELGKLNLDDPVQKYLPFKVVNPNFPQIPITIRHLATHTSSILDNEFYLSKNYFLKSNQDLKGLKLAFDDEQVFNSSDSSISMAAFLENVLTPTGKWNKDSFSNHQPGLYWSYGR